MERVIFYGAIVFAILAAIWFAVAGSIGQYVHFEGMGGDPVVEAAPGRLEPRTYQAASIDIEHVAAYVVVTTEDRQDMVLEIDNPGSAPMPEVSLVEGVLEIDGRLRGRIDSCTSDGGAELDGYGTVPRDRLTRITIRAPRDLVIEVGGAGITEIGEAASIQGDLSGCGDITIGDVSGHLDLDVAGAGEVRGGAAQSLDLDLAGATDASFGAVAERASLSLAGSGRATLASLTGSLEAEIAGSGGVEIGGGAVTTADLSVAGSGRARIAAPVQTLNVEIAGSGEIDVPNTVGDISAEIAGSGMVRVNAATGNVSKQIWGSGDVVVGQ